MESIELIRENLIRSRDLVLVRIEDMADHAVVFPTPRGGAHTLWVLGHLAYIEGRVIWEFMLGDPNPLADWEPTFDGADTSGDPADFPPFAEVLRKCQGMRAGTLTLIHGYTEADLDERSAAAPAGHEANFGTWRRCLQYVADHWLMHRGQLADARRAAGIDRMWL